MSNKLLVSTILIGVILFGGMALAKKAPGPESYTRAKITNPNPSPVKPMQNRYTADGYISRLYFPEFKAQEKAPENVASEYLGINQKALGIASDGSDLQLISAKNSLVGKHFRYQQLYNGVPVYSSQLLINTTYDGRITSVISDYKHNIDISTMPSISATTAQSVGLASLGNATLNDDPSIELIIYVFGAQPVLCWRVNVVADQPLGDWEIFVDAQTGQIVNKSNQMKFEDGNGFAFIPNPIVSEQNTMLADSTDRNYLALTNARDSVVIHDLNPPTGGYYYLTGPYVNTSATSNRARFTSPDSFYFNRQADQFEEVEAYFMLDSVERYYQYLGFTDVMNYSITLAVDAVTDDNSWYTPSQHRITYGSGGVDDAEDGDVIVHEYGHATQDDQVPGWGQTEEGGAMGEGWGDYLTVGFFHPVSGGWHEPQVFDWDANTRDHFWYGRRVDGNKHYPQDMDGEVHDDGEIWSRCLWDIQQGIGNDTTVQLVVESHFGLTSQANFDDGANAIIEADLSLYGGRHLMVIGNSFLDRGILTELPVHLDITHTPLTDVEDANGPFPILATVVHTFRLDSLSIYYKFDSDSTFSTSPLTPTGNLNEFSGSIPGPGIGSNVNYYIRGVDSIQVSANLPVHAPDSTFQFYAGPDTIRPVLTHTPIVHWPSLRWPPTITATATDNLGVDSVYVEYRINDGGWNVAALVQVDSSSTWRGTLAGIVVPGDTVDYRVAARDIATIPNIAYAPADSFYSIGILDLVSQVYMTEGFALPDQGSVGKQDTIIVPDHIQIFEADVYVDITHPRVSDLYFFVWTPRLYRITLHNRTGGDQANIVGWYDDDFTPDGPGSFDNVVGDSAQGRWIFYIADRLIGQAGTLNSWGVRIIGTGSVDNIDEKGNQIPEKFAIMQNYPNPFNPSTKISFMIANDGPVKLEIFDLLGRRVTTLLDKDMTAGLHSVEWSGRNDIGNSVSSGVYFARLSSGDKSSVIRMLLIK